LFNGWFSCYFFSSTLKICFYYPLWKIKIEKLVRAWTVKKLSFFGVLESKTLLFKKLSSLNTLMLSKTHCLFWQPWDCCKRCSRMSHITGDLVITTSVANVWAWDGEKLRFLILAFGAPTQVRKPPSSGWKSKTSFQSDPPSVI